jgi:hypothetical protein
MAEEDDVDNDSAKLALQVFCTEKAEQAPQKIG